MEVAGAAAGETTKSAIVHLERELGYVVHFKRNVNNLASKIQQLSAEEAELHRLIDVAHNNNERIRETVQAWLTRAETVHEEAMQLIDEAGHVNSWFKGWCCSRFSLGRKAEKKNAVIQGLLDERKAIGDNVSSPKPSQSLELVSAGDFDAFSSRESTAKQVIKVLSDEKISLVGVFGMPGVGKTTLMQAIAKRVKEEKLFQEVVMVTVSQNPSLEKIQGDIAKGLDLNLLDEDTLFIRAARLSGRLHQGKKILIVLDDVWERLDLATAGIRAKNNNNSCKVVFTTRHTSVCNQMEANTSIEVPLLPEKDSWALFRQKAGDVVDSAISPTISGAIVEKCKGLPLAITTLGLLLRNIDDELIWKETLTQLHKSIFEGMTPVVSSIRLSYEFLQNETCKLCFLFCCLFPEDDHIDTNVLLKYLIGENLIKNVDTLEESRSRLHSLVNKLTSSNLLLKGKDRYIMMHDVVRDVAISIASENDDRLGFIVKAGMGLAHWPVLELSKCRRLSLMRNKIRYDLPRHITAPHLVTLSLRDNKLNEIPNDFFNEMGSLLTLDLSLTGIESLPSSLSCLVNLRALILEFCNMDCISPIETLERLEIFSFQRSSVERNPEDIENWRSSLKLLDLSDSRWYQGIPPKMIASTFSLEELYVPDDCLVQDSQEEVTSHLECLTRLTVLESLELDPSVLSREIPNWENLNRFKLKIANEIDMAESIFLDFQTILILEIPSNSVVANWVKVLVAKTEALSLLNCEGLESVTELDGTGLNQLKFLRFQGSDTMKSLVNTVGKETKKCVLSRLDKLCVAGGMEIFESFCIGKLPDGFFCTLRSLKVESCEAVSRLIQADLLIRLQNLEKLKVGFCPRLEKLIESEEGFISNKTSTSNISNCPPSFSFPNLRLLQIDNCPLLEYVLSIRVARGLLQLTELEVSICTSMMTIFANDIGEDMSNANKDELILPKLKRLEVYELGKLSTLCPPDLTIHCPSLEEFSVTSCENLKRLPFSSDGVPKLQRLKVDLVWFNELGWEDERTKSRLSEVLYSKS